jgi:signal transduction protein with GAF and PtsI domain
VDKQMVKRPKTSQAKPLKTTGDHENGVGPFEERLRNAMRLVDAANALTSPLTRSIDNLLRVVAEAVNASEASVIVRDGNKGGLRFMSAIGEVAEKLLKVKIPPGKGIAGFVFSSGQPVAVSNAAEEESFYAEVDRATGYTTQILLATPLWIRGEVIGVLELINRPGEPPFVPFTPDEMDRAAHFADAIATLVDAYETANLVENMFDRSMKISEENSSPVEELRRWARSVRSAPEHKDMLSMAIALSHIADAGEAERQLCREVVDALGRWAKKRAFSPMEYSSYQP